MTCGGRAYRGRSAAERASERRERLLDAALDLIGTEGWSAATMTAICARAGLTERYFYESFRDREALYVALIDAIAADVEREVLAALAAAPDHPRDRLAGAARAVVRVLSEDPRRGRVALLEGLGSEPLQRRRRDILAGFELLIRHEAAAFFGSAAPPPERLEMVAVALVGAAGELLTRRIEGTLAADDDEVIEFMVSLSLAGARPRRP